MRRISGRIRNALIIVVPAGLLAVGLVAGQLRSSEWRWHTPVLDEVGRIAELEPIRALPRTEAVLATLEARRFMAENRPYSAWLAIQDHVGGDGPAGSAASLLAAQAAAGWGAWDHVREVLGESTWIETVANGDGLLLLARANDELGANQTAAKQYRRYLTLAAATRKGEAATRLGLLLANEGAHMEAAAAFQQAAAAVPEVSDWLEALFVRELVEAGDPSATGVATRMVGGSPAARMRRVELEAQAWETDAQSGKAIERLEWESRVLSASGAPTEAASLRIDEAELLFQTGRDADARRVLAEVASATSAAPSVRIRAARRLDQVSELTASELVAVAGGYESAGETGLAARSLRLALERGLPSTGELQLHLGHLLYDERDYAPARAAFQRAGRDLSDEAQRADASLYAARSLFRAGGSSSVRRRNRDQAMSELREITSRFPESAAAGTAYFLLGDEASTLAGGIANYRKAASITSSPDAREALYRVGDRSLKQDDRAAAIEAWETYVGRYPAGDETARIAYELGKMHQAAGRKDRARAMFEAAIAAEPTSYYAMRAGERIDVDPLDASLSEPRAWPGLASDPVDAAAVLERIDRLDQLGLEVEATAEIEAATRAFKGRQLASITFAEGLRDRERPVEAIRIARELHDDRNGEWDRRLLEVVFPLLYRDILVAEARRSDVDPLLYAGLVRQESTFRKGVKSWVGATGLGQIMPSTGRWLASSMRIRDYDDSMLEVPEINVRMGASYFGDLLDRYDGAADLALAGYNAGPSRADRWKRTLGHGADVDRFRAAIPFDETRNYVMVVLRNAAVYRRLYADELD